MIRLHETPVLTQTSLIAVALVPMLAVSPEEHPEVLATGMRYVIVNGKIAVEDGKYTGVLAGHPLRKTKP